MEGSLSSAAAVQGGGKEKHPFFPQFSISICQLTYNIIHKWFVKFNKLKCH